ncbi:MAG: site-2 protease family protein [Candidatus Pacearchaeota archaeon]|jgi:membrane-associated protease RseP (regulator of RpoE activity)
MAFVVYDLIFLTAFVLFVGIFLYTHRKNLKREGLLYLYRTKLGMKLIDYVGSKYKRSLKFLSYVSIGTGYLLMIGMFYLAYSILKIYVFRPDVVRTLKVPPITPLVPYIDKVVPGLPSFYFTYWIVILAIIAITHEFAHGILMKRYNIKIKSTGFGFFPFFFPIFLAAFVEQDEKSMVKKKNFEQMAVLSAGTFANVITAILFFIILIGFFSFAFTPHGVMFDSYQYSAVDVSGILSINSVLVSNPSYADVLNLANNDGLTKIMTTGGTYLVTMDLLNNSANKELFDAQGELILFDDAPAVNAEIKGAITGINNKKVNSLEDLTNELVKYSPGDEVEVETTEGVYEIILAENPDKEGAAYIGIGFSDRTRTGVMGKLVDRVSSFKEPYTNYEPSFGASEFIYNLLWWVVLISISVALINMLPVGIFDGGRFFYLTILSLTKKEKTAERWFRFSTYFFLFILFVLMIFWVVSFL